MCVLFCVVVGAPRGPRRQRPLQGPREGPLQGPREGSLQGPGPLQGPREGPSRARGSSRAQEGARPGPKGGRCRARVPSRAQGKGPAVPGAPPAGTCTGSTLAGMPWASACQLHCRGVCAYDTSRKPIACTWLHCGGRQCRQNLGFGGRLHRPFGTGVLIPQLLRWMEGPAVPGAPPVCVHI